MRGVLAFAGEGSAGQQTIGVVDTGRSSVLGPRYQIDHNRPMIGNAISRFWVEASGGDIPLVVGLDAAPKLDDPDMVAKRAEKAGRAAHKAERLAAANAEKAAAAEAEAESAKQKAAAELPKERTEAERKAERDRRYAARKARK